jgi:hypothetical protein
MTPIQYGKTNLEAFLLLSSMGALIFPFLSIVRLVLDGFMGPAAGKYENRVIAFMAGSFALVLVLANGFFRETAGWIIICGLAGLPILGILGNAIVSWRVFKSHLSKRERTIWIYGHGLSALLIVLYCLKAGSFILQVRM